MAKTDMKSQSAGAGQQQRPRDTKPKQKPRKAKVHVPPPDAANSSLPATPQAMIFRRGRVAHSVLSLVSDLRLLFSPHSSLRLHERRTNTMKDFLSVAPQLGVTHFLCLTQSEVGVNMRVIRIPQGPTVTFRVVGYSLMRDVVNAQKRPHSPASEYLHSPLVVLNNFSAAAAATAAAVTNVAGRTSTDVSSHLPLLSTILQHMFPSLHLPTLVLSHCRRVVLFHYDPTTQLIELRHYLITASPANLSRAMRRLVRGKLTDMSKYDDIADYVKAMEAGTAATAGSESEGEVAEDNKVTLGDRYVGRGNVRGGKSGVRLKELGPRITLSTLKIEEEFCGGTVLYHHYLSRSDAEVAELKAAKEAQKRERARRRAEQERNVRRKMGEDETELDEDGQSGAAAGEADDDGGLDGYGMDVEQDDGNDDERYYEEAVGEKPSKELFGKGDEGRAANKPEKRARGSRDADDEADETQVRIGKFKKRRIEAAKERQEQRRQVEESTEAEDGATKKKRTGGRRVGAGPRKPWIRGRGGKLETSRGAGGGRGGRGGGSERGRGSSGRGGGRGRGRGRGRGGR